jgi:hypothetical protein
MNELWGILSHHSRGNNGIQNNTKSVQMLKKGSNPNITLACYWLAKKWWDSLLI